MHGKDLVTSDLYSKVAVIPVEYTIVGSVQPQYRVLYRPALCQQDVAIIKKTSNVGMHV